MEKLVAFIVFAIFFAGAASLLVGGILWTSASYHLTPEAAKLSPWNPLRTPFITENLTSEGKRRRRLAVRAMMLSIGLVILAFLVGGAGTVLMLLFGIEISS